MKQPKKPTLEQKKAIRAAGLDWKTWNVIEENKLSLILISKKSGRKKVVVK